MNDTNVKIEELLYQMNLDTKIVLKKVGHVEDSVNCLLEVEVPALKQEVSVIREQVNFIQEQFNSLRKEFYEFKKDYEEFKKDYEEFKKDYQEFKEEFKLLKEEFYLLKELVEQINLAVIRIEVEHGKKLEILFDAFQMHSEQFLNHENRIKSCEDSLVKQKDINYYLKSKVQR